MPNLETFKANRVSMEKIDENAFQECKKLAFLSLEYNQFVKLERNAFKALTHLHVLFIGGGNIPVIDLDLTDLKQLDWFAFNNLSIAAFSPENLRGPINLREFELHSNNLFDLDIESMLKYTPNVQRILLTDNNFKCSRLQEILSILQKKNVKVPGGYSNLCKKRVYRTKKINDITCLSDEQWISELEGTSDISAKLLPTDPMWSDEIASEYIP